jgi:CDP-paratose 2-epimerase
LKRNQQLDENLKIQSALPERCSTFQPPFTKSNYIALRIIITGGAGFVESNLALAAKVNFSTAEAVCMENLYRRGSELNVARLEKSDVTFHRGDVRDPNGFPQGPFDFLVECSAEPSVLAGQDGSPDYLFQTNLVAAYHCLEKARVWQSRLLFLSISRVYPIVRLEAHPWREDSTRFAWEDHGTAGITSRGVAESLNLNGARSLYGYTKLSAGQLIEEYRATYGLKSIVNRCGVIAGPRQFGKVDQGERDFRRPVQDVNPWVEAHSDGLAKLQ